MTTLDKTPGAKMGAAPARGSTNPPPRILVVEDDVFIRQLNAKVLAGSGYHGAAAEDGAAGWEALHCWPLEGASGGYGYCATVLAARFAGNSTARVIPHCARVAVPLDGAQILWQGENSLVWIIPGF